MLEPHGSPMKWPGAGVEEDTGEASAQGGRAQGRSQDDAAVHYVFQRDPHEEMSALAPKQRWAVGDESLEVSCCVDNSFVFHINTVKSQKLLLFSVKHCMNIN